MHHPTVALVLRSTKRPGRFPIDHHISFSSSAAPSFQLIICTRSIPLPFLVYGHLEVDPFGTGLTLNQLSFPGFVTFAATRAHHLVDNRPPDLGGGRTLVFPCHLETPTLLPQYPLALLQAPLWLLLPVRSLLTTAGATIGRLSSKSQYPQRRIHPQATFVTEPIAFC